MAMNLTFEKMSSKYVLLRNAAQSFFQALRETIDANTFFLAETDGHTNLLIKIWNQEEILLTEGTPLPIELTYCNVVCSKHHPVIIPDTTQNSLTKDLPMTQQMGPCSFLGVPVVLLDGRLFGTIGVLDRKHAFTMDDVKLVEHMADFVSRLIELEETIVYDELTGLYRRGFLELLFYNLPADSKKAVAFLDLDDFKKINDTYGDEVGDEVLKRVGSVMGEICARHHAHACRYAGDEFALLFASSEDDNVLNALEQLMEDLSQPIAVSGYPILVTASIGLCTHAASLQQYIQRADTAMVQIKRGTKFGIQVFAMTGWDKTLEFSLRRALEDKRFHLLFQPIVDARNQTPVAIEALIRWDKEEHGILGPELFLPFAEKIGLIQQIDLWVIREACAQLLTWPNWEQSDMTINVNSGVNTLRDPGFADRVGDILKEYTLAPERLVIELNEKTSLYDANLIEPQVTRMAASGIRFSMDNFGQGYSSLGILRLLPISFIKIDRMFVHPIMNDPISESIINGLVTIAEKLELRLIAGGIETSEQRDNMRQLKCHQMQGHFFYKPMTLPDLRETADEVMRL
jgi:diguanylate cyclase (GGDEF)-like protein